MTGCPHPHQADAAGDGYCPICGLALPTVQAGICAGCGAARSGGAFCEHCGHHHDLAAASAGPPPPTRWMVVVAADRRQFDAFSGADRGFEFPDLPERRVELEVDLVRIGNAVGPAEERPEVDLCGPPADPGVSRQHAELLRQPDGSWAVRDAGSTNGTFVGRHRLVPGAVMPLAAGDRIRLGLWTCLTLGAES